MIFLDNIKRIKKLDSQGMWQSIESLGLQCQQAWEEAQEVKIPKSYRNIDNILINGMGGSGLGGHIIEFLYGGELKVPFKVINSYKLPGFVNQRTLYILSSYSGTTEEVLATLSEARKRRARLLVICAGGVLARQAKKNRIPGYIFTPRFNPCGQPRMGLGYAIVGLITMLKKCGLFRVTEAEFKGIIKTIVLLHRDFGLKTPISRNKAKKTAQAVQASIPIIVGAGHLAGNTHVIANQINENSKNFSAYFLISELNHHLMEGLLFPKGNRKNLHFLFIESSQYLSLIHI